MTDPAAQPPTGGYPGPTSSGGSWQPPTPPPGFQPAPAASGPAPGISYAGLVERLIALVIDGLILLIPLLILSTVLFFIPFLGSLLSSVLSAGLGAAYFVWAWTSQRASFGQRILKLETVSAADGSTLRQDVAITRALWLVGPGAAASFLSTLVGLVLPVVVAAIPSLILSLASLGYALYLAYTVSQSPRRQGYHDAKAGSVVIKRG